MNISEDMKQRLYNFDSGKIRFLKITYLDTNKISGIMFKKCDNIKFEEDGQPYNQIMLLNSRGSAQRLRTLSNFIYSIRLTIDANDIIAIRDDNMILSKEVGCFSDEEHCKVTFDINLNSLYSVALEPLEISINNAKLMLDIL